MTPPPAARRLDLVEVLHGIEVADPYRWLEDGDAAETIEWVNAQNGRTRAVLDALPDRRVWRDRLAELLAAPLSRSCRVAGESVFTMERAGGVPQFALVVRSAVDPTVVPRTLVDPAGLAADATTAIDWYHPSRDGRLVAYGVSEGGDERSTLRVLDVHTGVHLDDSIPHTRAASVGWWPDGHGFLYTRYPEDSEYGRMVYEHRLGEPWQDDRLVWGELPQPEAWPDVEVSADGRWALVHVSVGWSRTDVHLYDREADRWQTVIEGVDARSGLTVDRDRLLGSTTLDAPRGRVVVAPLDDPAAWTTLVEEQARVLDAVVPAGELFYVLATERSIAVLEVHQRDEARVDHVALPDVGTFAGFDADPATGVAFFQLESFTRPPALHRLAGDGSPEPWDGGGRGGDQVAFTVEQQTYVSADGTEVGLFVVHRTDEAASPATPAILTGYGGFAISSTPLWSPLAAAWCERGGLYAVAGLRGGSEEGEAWHADGMRERKQNVFDDFAAAADFLVGQGSTSRDRLALRGGSNGGLLVAAALTQRPALARAVHCAVPLADMVRFAHFLIARLWIPEYGDPDVAAELAWLHAYSPYHHVAQGESYPAVLITTAEGDSRVDPSHARKLAAQLQWASACQDERPILFHEEGRAGHGVGKPLHKQADEAADVLAFLASQVGLGGRGGERQ